MKKKKPPKATGINVAIEKSVHSALRAKANENRQPVSFLASMAIRAWLDGESHQRAERDREKAESEALYARLDQEARDKAPRLIEAGTALVKPDMVEEWRKYARQNTSDGYSAAVIEGTVQALQALADGKTPKEAERAAVAAETGFQMGCMAQALSHFAPRGDEFRAYWNRQYVSEEKAAEEDATGGVVNPAVLTIQGE